MEIHPDKELAMTKDTTCRDCGTRIGKPHELGCGYEICAVCDEQAITCDCDPFEVANVPRIPYRDKFPIDPDASNFFPSRLKPRLITLAVLILSILLATSMFG